MRLRSSLSVSLLFIAAAGAALAGTRPLRSQTTASHPTSTPYAGDLSIFEDPNRAKNLQIDRVMDLLHLHPGSTVADIGAGGGWFTVRAARRVAGSAASASSNAATGGQSGGEVIAEDINPQYIEAIRQRAQREHLTNIEPILGTPDDPKLAPDSLDAALMLKVFHEIAHTTPVLANLRAALKPGGRFGIIDRNGKGDDHGLDEKVVREEVERNGFKQVARYDFTKADGQDYFLIFEKR